MPRENDDDAWRAIVENFGDRADLDDAGAAEVAPPPAVPEEDRIRPADPEPYVDPPAPVPDDEDRFVPPDPAPLPIPTPDRGIAWLGVFGAPVVLLVSLLVGIDLPTWVGWLLVVWFVGGFVYLVHQMPREPRSPWDDGSRI
ncbi:hypothetical protein I601_2683 [Nocardioides dokdonensis FR1436]|uniref:Uncharacterized protein n=1 Tax=Nocardioides dokdonensis FR1436 TaxID=1300347 RepID=A0A1A9GLC7_9ACTN|nr:hypothetical protein [Nocardioides dokdonensis]ANH39099.1 hypothetical protein I601_2683 [Nocardioides dokdonensis FR1436]